MASKVNLITPPDILYDDCYSVLLIYPSNHIKDQFNDILLSQDTSINVYLYESEYDDHEPNWLLSVLDRVDLVIYDIDNSESLLNALSGYIISKNKTYWLTNGENLFYNKLSKNRVYDIESILENIGGNFEKKT